MLVVVGAIGPGDAKRRDVLLDARSEVRRASPDAMLAVLGGEIQDDPSEAVIEEKDGLFRLARPLSQSDLGMIEAAALPKA